MRDAHVVKYLERVQLDANGGVVRNLQATRPLTVDEAEDDMRHCTKYVSPLNPRHEEHIGHAVLGRARYSREPSASTTSLGVENQQLRL